MRTVCILGLCVIFICYAEMAFTESDEMCCTWVNMKYTSAKRPQKLIRNYDGTFASYISKTSVDALEKGTFRIVKKWNDSKGNIWYQVQIQGAGIEKKYELSRISNNGKKLECLFERNGYPNDINPNHANYCIYTRD